MWIEKSKLLLLFVGCTLLYFALSIPSNSIWYDQLEAINNSKDVLEGNFPLVGYLDSAGIHSFPAFYYFISPLVFVTDSPLFLYWSVAVFYIIGVLLLANYTFNKFGRVTCIIFLLISATHVWSLFFASFFWNPNYIPFFMSLFIIFLDKQINEKSSIVYFHFSGILLNIIVQMMPQSIILIPAFALILLIFKKLPNFINQILHVLIQFVMVYPWLHYQLFISDWNNVQSQQKLFKGFFILTLRYSGL